MRRTRELTAIHYRRSITVPVSPDVLSCDLHTQCPVCNSALEWSLVKEARRSSASNNTVTILRLVPHVRTMPTGPEH